MNYLLIGHICHDKAPDGFTLGGAVSYSGLAAKKLACPPQYSPAWAAIFYFTKNSKREYSIVYKARRKDDHFEIYIQKTTASNTSTHVHPIFSQMIYLKYGAAQKSCSAARYVMKWILDF